MTEERQLLTDIAAENGRHYHLDASLAKRLTALLAKPQAESNSESECIHGFTLPAGQDVSTCEWWSEFAEYFESKEGFAPHPHDTGHKRAFEYFVEGAFQQYQLDAPRITA